MPMGYHDFRYLRMHCHQLMTGLPYSTSVKYMLSRSISRTLKLATKHDSTLIKVLNLVKRGWTKEVPENVQPYVQHQNEFSIENGCLLWGTQVVIHKSVLGKLLHFFHESDPGITRMKALARSYFWCIGLDRDIKSMDKFCETCQVIKSNPYILGYGQMPHDLVSMSITPGLSRENVPCSSVHLL